MVTGVTTGWSKQLELSGTGFRAEVRGSELLLTVGYSHTISVTAPQGITFLVEKNVITVSGTARDVVSQTAANIRAVREPDAYQGKGIKYKEEQLKLKPGKQAAKAA
jgi:large subunit ribosomal protein L6